MDFAAIEELSAENLELRARIRELEMRLGSREELVDTESIVSIGYTFFRKIEGHKVVTK